MPHTHALTIAGDTVRKRFVSWEDGEAEREWAGLTTVARHRPGLAPEPIALETEDGAPVVVMSRLPGMPLESTRLSADQTNALASALRAMFSIPVEALLPERPYGPSVMRTVVRTWAGGSYDLHPCQDPALVEHANGGFRRNPPGSTEDQARRVLTLLG